MEVPETFLRPMCLGCKRPLRRPQRTGRPSRYCVECTAARNAVPSDEYRCTHCHELFVVVRTVGRRPEYCGDDCKKLAGDIRREAARKKPKTAVCVVCYGEFTVNQGPGTMPSFCSKECSDIAHKPTVPFRMVTCTGCFAPFKRPPESRIRVCETCRGGVGERTECKPQMH